MPRSNRSSELWQAAARRLRSEEGSASLEFVTAGLILLLPTVYLVLVVAAVQGGALAVEGAARQAARVFVTGSDERDARESASRAVDFALQDYGLSATDATVEVRCLPRADECLTREGTVTVSVRVAVALPLVPQALDLTAPLSVPLEASATQRVSRFWGAG